MKRVDSAVVLTAKEYEALKETQRKLCCSKKVLVTSWATTLLLTVISLLAFFFDRKGHYPTWDPNGSLVGCNRCCDGGLFLEGQS